jgi:hypothetical protein
MWRPQNITCFQCNMFENNRNEAGMRANGIAALGGSFKGAAK